MINLSQNGYTHNDVLRLLQSPQGVRNATYKLQVLRQNIWVMDAEFTAANLECRYFDQVKYSSSITIHDDPRIDWRTDFFRPVMLLADGDNALEFQFVPLKPMTVKDEIKRGQIFKHVEAYDESVVLQGNSLGDTIVIPAGTLYVAAVESLVNRAGFTRVSIAPSDKSLTIDRVFEPGEEIMTVANLLLSEINYRSLEMGRDGILTSYKYELPTVDQAQIHYRADGTSVVLDDKTVERDSYKRPNRFVGFMNNPEIEEPLRYEFTNDNPASPTSTVSQGYVITAQPRQYDNIADLEALMENVRRWASEEDQSYEYVKLTTAIMPHHEVREIITVDSFGVNGVYTETGWRITNFAADGKMEHELRVAVYG